MKVMMVSEDRVFLRHLSRFLKTFGYESAQLADYQRAAEIAESLRADMLIVDLDRGEKALEFCRAVSGRDRANDSYTLMTVAEDSLDRLTDALEAGADDFLAKPIVYGEVLMRLRAGSRVVEFRRRARQQRCREPITGLLSCAAFHDRLRAAGSGQITGSGRLACVRIDVDFMDRIAKTFGKHAECDALGELAERLGRLCENRRAELAHFGEGRFCAILPGTSLADAAQWAETVRSAIRERPVSVEKADFQLTVSVGVADMEIPAADPQTLLTRAEHALQTAKASGRDCVVRHGQFQEEAAAWQELAAPGKLLERTVARDVMLPSTPVLRTGDQVRSAVSLFRQTQLARLVVVDETGRLAGAVSSADVAEAVNHSAVSEPTISDFTTRQVEVLSEDASFRELIEHFAQSDSEYVVIVEDGRPTGLVTPASLASLSQSPEWTSSPVPCPSMQSGYLRVAEPLMQQAVADCF